MVYLICTNNIVSQPNEELQQLKAPNGGVGDYFGISLDIKNNRFIVGTIANVDQQRAYIYNNIDENWSLGDILIPVDGDNVIVGSPRDIDNGANSGLAYIFTKTDGVWQQQSKLLAIDGAIVDLFGSSVSMSGSFSTEECNSKSIIYVNYLQNN